MGRGTQGCAERTLLHVDPGDLRVVCAKPVFAGPLLVADDSFCLWLNGQADAGDAPLGAVAIGLLAAGADVEGSPVRRNTRPHAPFVAIALRKAAAVAAGGRVVRGDDLGAERSAAAQRADSLPGARGKRLGFLCRLPGPVLLSGRIGRVLPAVGSVSADRKSRRRGGPVGRRLRRSAGLSATVSLFTRGLAMVCGNAGAGDRAAAGWRAGDGGPLHVLAPNRLMHCFGLGSRGRVPGLAFAALVARRRVRHRAGAALGRRMASDVVLARQRDALDAHPRLRGAKLPSPQQSRQRTGQPKPARRGKEAL